MYKILIIDDDDDFRKVLKKDLEDVGYNVLEAVDGQQGLDIVNIESIDLVVCDIFMPEEDGVGFLMKIMQLTAHPKIIMTSGGGIMLEYSFLDISRKLGADKILEKPFLFNELHSYIKELLP